ncbi:uncharacterized protein LOC108630699 [Ceratina calcarata]|uniref:Uncharacterized protein LOC108630699 n=1 Tax=Ceratina calcarata TaxID=156304 RepID=A0AAJ7JCR4_9HYME|nr:uncharacterized protein LOC108630699 [Ceratina calcarata]
MNNCVVEERLGSMQSENALVQDNRREMIKNDGRLKPSNDESKPSSSSSTELFPWMLDFKRMCRCAHIDKSMTSLTELMQFYVRNVSVSINECYTRPLRAAKLKDSISETLMLFLYIYRDLSEDRDRSTYLNNMSNLLALYIDMELKVSKKSTEGHNEICARLTSCLYVYLEHSIEHLLDTLMKIQFMCRNYHHILDPVITKIMKNVPTHPESDIMYVRYFFIYRLWRKINENAAAKSEITAAAIESLGPLPPTFTSSILKDVLPKVPKSQPNFTKALLQQKFDIKKRCETFVQYCGDSDGRNVNQRKDGTSIPVDSSSRINPKMLEDIASKNVERLDNNVNSIISDKAKQNESICLVKTFKTVHFEEQNNFKSLGNFSNNISTERVSPKTSKSNQSRLQMKRRKSNEVVIIDLTSDVVFEKCIKKRKSRKLTWLEEAKKRASSKIARASRKIKQIEEENAGASKGVDRQAEDCPLAIHAAEFVGERKETILVNRNDENKMDYEFGTEETRKLMGAKVNTNEINIKSATVNGKAVLTEIVTRQPSRVTGTVIENCLSNGDISGNKRTIDEKENDIFNERTVIKRLIETRVYSEPDTRSEKKAESFKNGCDSKAERPAVNNATTYAECDSKDDRSNLDRPIDDEVGRSTTTSTSGTNEVRDSVVSASEASNIRFDETTYRSDCSNVTVDNDKSKEMIFTEATSARTSSVEGILHYENNRDSLDENSTEEEKKVFTPRTECTNDAKRELCARTGLDVCDYNETSDSATKNKSRIANIRESIFESYSTDERDISNTVNKTCPSESIKNNENFKKPMSDTVDKYDSNFACEPSRVPSESNGGDGMCKLTENKYMVEDFELQDNIDGLSLLASVSQHVSHMKPETETKCDQIKVKDYATLRYTCCSQMTDDEADTNDSSNTVSRLLENPSAEVINRIVGVYPENALEKVTVRVEEVTSDKADDGNGESCEVVSHPETTGVNYDADTLSDNLAPTENSPQTVKENTNVILNGETVVLLQKSPNSNLYIINKAVENSKDGDDEIARSKNWASLDELETVLDNISYNLELTAYSKEPPYQEGKCSVVHGKGMIKVEPEDGNFSNAKAYTKNVLLSTDVLNSSIYQDTGKSIDNRKAFRQNIKQEFNNIPNHIASSCAIPGCKTIHPHEIDGQHTLLIPATSLPPIYGNCGGNGDLCVPYHKHCGPVSCSLQMKANTSLRSHGKSGSDRTRCSCLNCPYDTVAHCRQCMHSPADARVSCIESNPYFLPTHSSVQTDAVQEHDRANNDPVIGKLYDDQVMRGSLLQSNSSEAQDDSEKIFNTYAESKLPLKKRLKAHAMAYREVPIKSEKLNPLNYPAIPMMSIAELDTLDAQKRSGQIVKSEYEIHKEEPHNGYHYNSSLMRRNYYKDVHLAASHQNLAKNGSRKKPCVQRTIKSGAQRKDVDLGIASLNGYDMEPEGTYKKAKKTQSSSKQTRSSKRNVPKVNYSYTDVDPEWNPSGESKRKRKKTNR